MPNKNTIVAAIARIEPPVEASGAEMFKRNPDGFSIIFDDDQTARLNPGEQASGQLDILEGLRRMDFPAYVELDAESQGICRLLIPLVSRVLAVSGNEKKEVVIELESSHARHVLTQDNPDFSEHLQILHAAREKDTWLTITATDQHAIIDVRLNPHPPDIPNVEIQAVPAPKKYWWCRWFKWLCCLRIYWRCVSESKARQMFDLVSATTCDPLTVPAPCIPFLYPDDGCWARAHEMCRLMIAAGVNPKKVWIDGNLQAATRNTSFCVVFWGWHVAPTLCVRRGFCRIEDMVIDPSLFTGPVTKSAWKGAQGDASALLTDTDATVYWRNYIPTDPAYIDTNIRLTYYRLQLQNRSLGANGPPPYANCP